MNAFDSVPHLISLALHAIKHHPLHDLNLGYRWALYSAFGSKSNNINSLGYQRRTYLSILATEYVLPIWNSAEPITLPDEPMNGIMMMIKESLMDINALKPSTLLFLAKEILSGNIQPTNDVWMQAVHCIDFCRIYRYQYSAIEDTDFLEVAYAAAHTLEVAIEDEQFAEENSNLDFTEIDSKKPESDVAFYAACAYSKGPIWVEKSDAYKRLQFWTWWLTSAVPKALKAFP
jgi:hypothetical protein